MNAKSLERKRGELAYREVLLYSLLAHFAIIVIIPITYRLFHKEKIFIRPQTFQLVKMSQPTVQKSKPKAKPVAKKKSKPKPIKKKVATKPTPAKKRVKKSVVKKKSVPKESVDEVVEEDLDELAELLGGISKPVSSISVGKPFKYQWYLNNIRAKVERNWKPPFRDEKKFVRLEFTILRSGKVSNVKIVGSSGNSAVDNIGVRAVRLASPFGKLPVGFSGKTLEIEYTLWLSAG